MGIVIAGESDGLVGAAIRRSPVGLADGVDPFAHPDVRDWLSLTPEPEYSRSTALVVGRGHARAGSRHSLAVRPAARRGGIAGQSRGLRATSTRRSFRIGRSRAARSGLTAR